MKFHLANGKIKKVSSDKGTTTFRHEDGHTITISHQHLSPKMRAQLAEIPMHSDKNNPKLEQSKKEPQKLAEGGEALDVTPVKEDEIKTLMDEKVPEDKTTAADKLDVVPASDKELTSEDATLDANSTPVDLPAAQPLAVPQQSAAPTAAPASAQPMQQPAVQTPDIVEGYQKQQQGLAQQQQAESAMGAAESKVASDQLRAQNELLGSLKTNLGDYQTARKQLIDSINKNQINPEKYWENHSKLLSGIGILIAGFNPTNSPNAALEFLNKQIDRSIQSQAANLSSQENLLKMNFDHFHNMNEAVTMTKVMMSDIAANQMRVQAGKLQDPMSKAKLLMEAGKLEQSVAPQFFQLMMRKSVIDNQASGAAGKGGISSVDPSSLIQYVVPEAQQAKVAEEIDNLKYIKKHGDQIIDAFDSAAKESRTMSGGGLRSLASPISSTASQKAFKTLMGPTFNNIEGTVRQAAMDSGIGNTMPTFGDDDKTVAIKRRALIDYLQSNSQKASLAKASGLDLDKFDATKWTPKQSGIYAVPIQAPNGTIKMIPSNLVDAALKAGGKRVK